MTTSPTSQTIDPELKNPEYDPENLYSVPYMWGLMGVIYNTTMVDEADLGSWDLLWNEKYAGEHACMIDNSRDAIGIALKCLGYSYNTTDEAQIHRGCRITADRSRSPVCTRAMSWTRCFRRWRAATPPSAPTTTATT